MGFLTFRGLHLQVRDDVPKKRLEDYLETQSHTQDILFDKVFGTLAKVKNARHEIQWLWSMHSLQESHFEDEQLPIFRCLIFFLKYKTSIRILRSLTNDRAHSNLTLLAELATWKPVRGSSTWTSILDAESDADSERDDAMPIEPV